VADANHGGMNSLGRVWGCRDLKVKCCELRFVRLLLLLSTAASIHFLCDDIRLVAFGDKGRNPQVSRSHPRLSL
jgi:hypothetical protein